MPRDVHIIPPHHSDARHQRDYGTYQDHDFRRNIVESAFGDPHKEHTDKYSYRLEFLHCHLSHRVQFLTKAFHSTLDLRLLLFRLQREDDLRSDEPSQKQENHRERECGKKPVGVAERE